MQQRSQSLLKVFLSGITLAALFLCTPPDSARADKTAVSISAPATASPGSEITIRVTATHDANNFLHHTDWLKVMADGKEIGRWDYSWNNKPEGKVFSKEIKYTVTGNAQITAEGHCNIHGSAGPQTVTVSAQSTSD